MKNRIRGQANALRRPQKEEGFTLIELLVVVVILSTLAALAIFLFRDQQVHTIRGSVQYDVRNTASQVQLYLVDNNNATETEIQENIEVITSPDNVLLVEGNYTNWIVYGYNSSVDPDGTWWFVYDSAAGTWQAVDEQPVP